LVCVDIRHHNDKFLPAQTTKEVAAADDFLKLSAKALEHEIAEDMLIA
jgi:hypothetical protein